MTTIHGQPLLSRLGRQVQEYYVRKQREIDTQATTRKALLTTATAVRHYQSKVRSKFVESLGPFPERGSLAPSITGTLTRNGYRVEKVIFDSLPGWRVTSNLYVPDSATAQSPAPGVLFLCGHDTRAKWYYADAAQGFVKLGYVCLIIDMVGGGERLMIPSQSPVVEHKQIGRQLALAGWSMSGLQTWDASRGIDYLVSREEVDATKIGVHGHSGGGTQAMLVTAFDERVTMSAPSCWATSWRRQVENELTPDHEQTPIGISDLGVDDILLLHAPKPLVLIEKELDYWDVRGVKELYAKLRHFYDLLGAPQEYLQLHIGPGEHQLNKNGREAAYRLFSLLTGLGTIEPTRADWETIPDLNCTESGSVLDLPDSVHSTDICTQVADSFERGATGEALKDAVRTALGVPETTPATPPEYRIWEFNTTYTVNYPLPKGCIYAVETDHEIITPLYFLSSTAHAAPLPEVPLGTRALLYVSHESADKELKFGTREPLVTSMLAAEPGVRFFAVDLRDTGESASVFQGYYPDDNHAQTSDRLGEPILGKCVWDLLRVIDLLAAHGYTDIHVGSRGWGTMATAFAALLDDRVTKVTLKNALTRWYAVAKAKPDQYAWPNSRLPGHVLRHFDLPEVYDELQAKDLSIVDAWGAWLNNPNGEF